MTRTASRSPSSGRSELSWSQLRTGAALLVAITLALAAIFLSDVVARELAEGERIAVAAGEARDLEPGAAVWVAGVPAGRVTAVRFRAPGGEQPPVLVRATLDEEAAGTLRADATARIRSSALLAPAVLALDPGHAPRPLDLGDTLRARPGTDREEIRARSDSLAGALEELTPLADSLRRRVEEGPGTLASLRRDDALRADLRRAGDRARSLAEAMRDGSLARLARDTAVVDALRRVSATARRLSAADGNAAAGAESVARRMAVLLGRLDSLAVRLGEARGTAGRLLHDDALERERRRAEAKMDSLRIEMMADPLRWLRFRLF